jgi:hypothetical protein
MIYSIVPRRIGSYRLATVSSRPSGKVSLTIEWNNIFSVLLQWLQSALTIPQRDCHIGGTCNDILFKRLVHETDLDFFNLGKNLSWQNKLVFPLFLNFAS